MILIDYNGIAIANLVTQRVEIEENFLRHTILNSIRMHVNRFKSKYGTDNIVIAGDGQRNWRYEAFPNYKAKRRSSREQSNIDWTEVFRVINLVFDEIGENFPYKTIKLAECEADDIIGTLAHNTQEFGRHEPVMIVSGDKDFVQLQKYDNVAQYSPVKKKFLTETNPRKQLLELILKGDTADGIPNVLSDDNVFVEGIRQTPLNQKKMDAIVEDLSDGELLHAASWYRNYQRNKKLIDLAETPDHLKQKIINIFDEQVTANKSKILPYLIEKRCRQLVDSIGDFI